MGNLASPTSELGLCEHRGLAKQTSRASGLALAFEPAARGWQIPVCAVATLYLILPNLAQLISARSLGASPHGYINLDYLMIGALGIFLPRGLVLVLLCMESIAASADSVCTTYQFSLGDLVSSLRYLPVLPRERVLEGVAVVTAGMLACAALALIRPPPQKRLRAAFALLACFIVPTAIDIFDGQNLLWRKDVTLSPYRLAHSSAFTLGAREVHAYSRDARSRHADDAPMMSASSRIITFFGNRQAPIQSPNVVLIVVESWGLPLDAHLAQGLTEPYADPRIASKYNISFGTVPYTGLTVPGEARELCHSTDGFGILHVSNELVEHCMPAFFHARGYRNIAVHGFVGQMFYRSSWYPQLGFDRSWFGPDLHGLGLLDCPGAFPGVCDTSIASWIGSTLQSEQHDQPKFIYWVTLNSHLPVPQHPDLPDDGVCAIEPALRDSAALCSWFRLVRAVHQSVQLTALVPTARPTVFVLVGDHAPPFGDPRLRADFSSSLVPYEMLTPKDSPPR
jgi:phosphoglycerol transferase MdoB-like AlkP superfamily enzyme